MGKEHQEGIKVGRVRQRTPAQNRVDDPTRFHARMGGREAAHRPKARGAITARGRLKFRWSAYFFTITTYAQFEGFSGLFYHYLAI